MAEIAFQSTAYNPKGCCNGFNVYGEKDCFRPLPFPLIQSAMTASGSKNRNSLTFNRKLCLRHPFGNNRQLKTFYAKPLIFKKNCSTFAVRFMGYPQGCRGSGKFFNKKT